MVNSLDSVLSRLGNGIALNIIVYGSKCASSEIQSSCASAYHVVIINYESQSKFYFAEKLHII